MKKDIFEIPKSENAGIYMLYNINKHIAYIGETNNFNKRANTHKHNLLKNNHPNKQLQIDFNNGCEFSFTILDDMGKTCDKEKILLKEKQYIYAFLEKSIKIYNHETREQLIYYLFFYMVCPEIDKIRSKFHNKFGCELGKLERCKPETLKEKFIIKCIEKGME